MKTNSGSKPKKSVSIFEKEQHLMINADKLMQRDDAEVERELAEDR